MPVPDALLGDAAVAGPLGSLALSCVRPANATMGLRALRWHESLTRLGVVLPLFLVHDVGMIFGVPPEQREIVARCNPNELATSRVPLSAVSRLVDVYRAILAELADSEASRRAGQLKLGDDLVAAVLGRLLGVVAARAQGRPAYPSRVPVDPSILERIEPQLGGLFRSVDRTWDTGAIETLELARLFVLTLADSLDTDTLKLFGLLGTDSGASAMGHVDLLAAFQSPEANDIVNFSLEILPSVLETKTRPAAGTSLAQGYSGIGNRGSIDSMVLTELAWDDLELARRLFDNELLYYAREQSRDEQKRIHILLVDASASMRGDRTTFARGMALATGKKLLLEGEDVVFRFFDSRLYEPARAKGDRMPTAYLLSFKGERGRNPARVFAELSTELELMKTRDARAPVVHLFTHAALYIPRELVANVRQLAHIAAVFILPSGGKLDLDYLDVLDAHWVVDHETLSQRGARGEAAKSILGQSEGLRRDLEGADPAPKADVAVEAPPASRRITGRADAPPPSRRGPGKGVSP